MAINWKNVSILKDDLKTWVSGANAREFASTKYPSLVRKVSMSVLLLDETAKKNVVSTTEVTRLLEKCFPKRVVFKNVQTVTPTRKGGGIRGGSSTISTPAPPYEKIQFVGFKVRPDTVKGVWEIAKKTDTTINSTVKGGKWHSGAGCWILVLPIGHGFSTGDVVTLTDPDGIVHELKVVGSYPNVIAVDDGPLTAAPLNDASVAEETIPKNIGYKGHDDASTDLDSRALIMKNAIKAAFGAVTANEKILKVFMAPEFYWRNAKGAYPLELMPDILIRMAEEIQDDKYKDWLFVLGTAIGYLPHGEGGEPLKYRYTVTQVDGGNTLTAVRTGRGVSPLADPHKKAQANVTVAVWERIPEKTVYPWKVHQGTTGSGEVAKVTRVSKATVKVELDVKSGVFAKGDVVLEEPIATELFNVALIQKGGTANESSTRFTRGDCLQGICVPH